MENKNLVLVGEDIYRQLVLVEPQDGNQRMTTPRTPGSISEPYWVLGYAGKGIVIRKTVHDLFMAGQLGSITLSPNSRTQTIETVDNDGNPHVTNVTVEGWSYAGHTSNDQEMAIAEHRGIMKQIETTAAKKYEGLSVSAIRAQLLQNATSNKPKVQLASVSDSVQSESSVITNAGTAQSGPSISEKTTGSEADEVLNN